MWVLCVFGFICFFRFFGGSIFLDFGFLFVFQVCIGVFYSRFIIPSRYQLQDNNQQTIRVGRTLKNKKKTKNWKNLPKNIILKSRRKLRFLLENTIRKTCTKLKTHTVTGSHTTAKIRGFYAGVIIKSLACAK